MNDSKAGIHLRPMTAADIGAVPIGCQGGAAEVRRRIADLGSSAILAFDGGRHVGQLQFRRYDADSRSPDGIWHPLYWGDFGARAPRLPARTLAIHCYHVGQLDDTDRRDPAYQGRGIGLALLDYLLGWAERQGFEAVVAKATPPLRPVMAFMGGQPPAAYTARGFEVVARWLDPQLRDAVREKSLVGPETPDDRAARLACCVKRL